MNILSMLVRLQGTLGRTDLVNQMLLLPQAKPSPEQAGGGQTEINHTEINLVVGYSNSPKSQTALDLTLWIAHQTRLATGKQVTVQVVYVVDNQRSQKIPVFDSGRALNRNFAMEMEGSLGGGTAVAELEESQTSPFAMSDVFETADRILWQARCLAEEWRGSLKTHLRFGAVAEELRTVIEAESASLLILGCESKEHALVKKMRGLPCPVLGIPSVLD